MKMSGRRSSKSTDIGRVVGGRKTQNSASAALFNDSRDKDIGSDDDDDEMPSTSDLGHKRPRTPRQVYSPKSERKQRGVIGPSTSTPRNVKEEQSAEDDTEPEQREEDIKKKMKKKKTKEEVGVPSLQLERRREEKENIVTDGSVQITDEQRRIYKEIADAVQAQIEAGEKNSSRYQSKVDKEPRLPRQIQIGKHILNTWYSSPYPMEYIHVPSLFICDFCLKYVRTEEVMKRHMLRCEDRNPPGQEIYRYKDVSVFEVDGNRETIYCQNLCLLSKMYLDHKTLYYDVEPFLFYVVTVNDDQGFHFVGYFSKEKYSNQKFNLSCIVTLPCYQKKGFGRFLIDFSFLLSRREGVPGTPERPLSDLGRISYASYWRTTLFEWVYKNVDPNSEDSFSIDDIVEATGISHHDVLEMMDALDWLEKDSNGDYGLCVDYEMCKEHWEKAQKDPKRIWINEDFFKWTPKAFSPSKDNFRSPIRTPPHSPPKNDSAVAQPSSSKTTTPSGVPFAAVGSTIKSGQSTRKRAPVGRNLKQKLFEEENRKNDESILNPGASTASDNESSEDDTRRNRSTKMRRKPAKSCRETTSRSARKRDDSPEDDIRKRGRRNEKVTSPTAPSTDNEPGPSRVKKSGASNAAPKRKRRGKGLYEGNEETDTSNRSSEESDYEHPFETGKKGKPQKGKASSQPRRRAPPKKGNKGSETNGDKVNTKVEIEHAPTSNNNSEVPSTSQEEKTSRLTNGSQNGIHTDPSTSHAEESEQEMKSLLKIPTRVKKCDKSYEDESDPEKKEDVQIEISDERHDAGTPMSYHSSPATSPVRTPEPIGDAHFNGQMMNLGMQPLNVLGAHSSTFEDNDGPPMLAAEPKTEEKVEEPTTMPTIGISNSGEQGYSSGDDDAPPQLSPAMSFVEQEKQETEESEKFANIPPMAMNTPLQHNEVEGNMYHRQMSHTSMSIIPPNMVPESLGAGPSSNHQMHMSGASIPSSSCPPNMMSTTPQHSFSHGPGSMQQATPGSGGVPSCGPAMFQQSTPEQQQQTFMSPPMQQMPSSVGSVHSAHNNSLEMVNNTSLQHTPQQPPPVFDIPQMNQMIAEVHNPLNGSMNGQPVNHILPEQNQLIMQPHQFGSPQNPAPVQIPLIPPPQVQPMPPQIPVQQPSTSTANNRRRPDNTKKRPNQRAARERADQLQQQAVYQQQMQQQLHMQQQFQQFNPQAFNYPGYAYPGAGYNRLEPFINPYYNNGLWNQQIHAAQQMRLYQNAQQWGYPAGAPVGNGTVNLNGPAQVADAAHALPQPNVPGVNAFGPDFYPPNYMKN